MIEMFPLFKNNDNIEEGISDKFISVLSQCNNPHIISISGDESKGKSTKLNQIINGIKVNNYYSLKGPFKIKTDNNIPQTKLCDFYGPIKVKDLLDRNLLDINAIPEFDKNILNDELFFVETEGLKSKKYIAGILSILQLASINIMLTPMIENEKIMELVKNSKISNILNLSDFESETIFLIRDVPISDEYNNVQQINEQLLESKEFFIDKINTIFDNLNKKKAIFELLPFYELAKRNIDDYSQAYKMNMRNLVKTILLNIKKNNNINGSKLIEIIKELIEIFKQIDDIEIIKNEDNAFKSLLKRAFEQKVKTYYLEINDKINHYDKNIILLENKNEDMKKYLIDYIKNRLQYSWNIYYNSIKDEMNNIIKKYQSKLNIDILNTINKTQEKINEELISILNVSDNKEINDYLSKFNYFEEINKNEIDKLIIKIKDNFFEKYKKEFECLPDKYKLDIQKNLDKNLEENINNLIILIPKREIYLKKVFEDIKYKIVYPLFYHIFNSNKLEIEQYLDLNLLKQKICLYVAQNNIKAPNKEDFKKKLNELYVEIKRKLEARIGKNNLINPELKERTIADGIYLIKPKNNKNKVLHIDNNNLVIWDFKNEKEQKFEIKYDSFHKCYTIKNIGNNQYLTCDKSIIYSAEKNNNINQQWHIVNNNTGYEIISEKNNKLFKVEENDINGAKITCEIKIDIPEQIFYFEATTK